MHQHGLAGGHIEFVDSFPGFYIGKPEVSFGIGAEAVCKDLTRNGFFPRFIFDDVIMQRRVLRMDGAE